MHSALSMSLLADQALRAMARDGAFHRQAPCRGGGAHSHLCSGGNNSHNLVAEPGFEEMDIVLPNSGFFTLYWQQRTGCMPFRTSHDAHVPALHW